MRLSALSNHVETFWVVTPAPFDKLRSGGPGNILDARLRGHDDEGESVEFGIQLRRFC